MPQAKELFINAVCQVRVHGSSSIPTVVRYAGGKSLIGVEALQGCEDPSDLREDFKVEIGNEDPLKLAQRTGAGTGRSILGVAKDFTERVINIAFEKIAQQGSARPTKILVAEPLALAGASVSHDRWLQNYRQSLRRILASSFDEVDFMPEPFAVFQYTDTGCAMRLLRKRSRTSHLSWISGAAPLIPASLRRQRWATLARRAEMRDPWLHVPSPSVGSRLTDS